MKAGRTKLIRDKNPRASKRIEQQPDPREWPELVEEDRTEPVARAAREAVRRALAQRDKAS